MKFSSTYDLVKYLASLDKEFSIETSCWTWAQGRDVIINHCMSNRWKEVFDTLKQYFFEYMSNISADKYFLDGLLDLYVYPRLNENQELHFIVEYSIGHGEFGPCKIEEECLTDNLMTRFIEGTEKAFGGGVPLDVILQNVLLLNVDISIENYTDKKFKVDVRIDKDMEDDLEEEEKTYMEKHGDKLSGVMKSLFEESIEDYTQNYLPNNVKGFDLRLEINDCSVGDEIDAYDNIFFINLTENIGKEEIISDLLDGKAYEIVD